MRLENCWTAWCAELTVTLPLPPIEEARPALPAPGIRPENPASPRLSDHGWLRYTDSEPAVILQWFGRNSRYLRHIAFTKRIVCKPLPSRVVNVTVIDQGS